MNNERLDWLEDVLQKVIKEKKQFNMRTWLDIPADAAHTAMTKAQIVQHEPSCGTAACAIGYCALDPRFQKAGLRLKYVRNCLTRQWVAFPVYRSKKLYDAIAAFLDIPYRDAERLFEARSASAREVLAEVRGYRKKSRSYMPSYYSSHWWR